MEDGMNKIVIKERDIISLSPLVKGLMNMAFALSCVLDRNGYVIHCSDNSPMVWNRPNEESIGRHINELDGSFPYEELIRTKKPVLNMLRFLNGRTVIGHILPLFDKSGEIIGIFTVLLYLGLEKLKDLVRENALDDNSMILYHQLSRAEAKYSFDDFITRDARMHQLIERLKKLSGHTHPLLIVGETGCGKEILANGVHTYSSRDQKRPFVRINCNAIPADLMESELFGHERGAFPGAQATKIGKFEMAGNGTILLDEIAGLTPDLQAKLLRVIEAQEFERVGGSSVIPLKARIIATTNGDVRDMIDSGVLRKDLYYRLSAFEINVPPLRERRDDISVLAAHFLKGERTNCTLAPDAVKWMTRYSWPGNVRQLKNLMTRIGVMEETGKITLGLLKEHLDIIAGSSGGRHDHIPAVKARESAERAVIVQTLEECNYNISAAARALDLSRSTLYSRIKRYGLDR